VLGLGLALESGLGLEWVLARAPVLEQEKALELE
jgi:hypothetical protein